ncbi:branched-chain amino acid ABC transporter permease [Amycolatopsis arida]|uniref:branched-chain amino acid ABC transporter permease n=1 Tax=Amycolatopsis arida TaxID=587909 RepID=UPI001FBC045A|nr:carboxypeptidase regulatory-like domain-containing protein [Amycolatopsis arida]
MRRTIARSLVLLALSVLTVLLPAVAAAAQDGGANDGEALRGTLRGPDGPVSGAVVTVLQDGTEVGTSTSDADGDWRVALPGPGAYEVRLDLSTLPSGIVPRQQGGEVLRDVTVSPSQARAVIFPLVQEGAAGEPPPPPTPAQPPFPQRFGQALLSGIQFGAVIAISAIGLSLIFGTTRLINFAHGELVTIGAVVAFFFNAAGGGPALPLVIAALLAVAAGALVGGGLETTLWRPLRNRNTGRISLFIISIGLSLLLRHVILVFYGSRPGSYTDFDIQSAVDLGPVSATPRDLSIVGLSVLVLVGVALMLQRTRIGTAIRAVSDNRDLAESSGIDVNRVVLVVWLLGGGLAALGGVMYGLAEVVSWDMGFKLLLMMFAGIILGGLGSAYGAMIGSFVVGIVAHLSTLWFPVELQFAWALLVLIVVLLVRPQGILGRRERIG